MSLSDASEIFQTAKVTQKFYPFTVRLNAALPAVAEGGDSELIDGSGLGVAGRHLVHAESVTTRSRNALPITDTELRLIAAAATIGESSSPNIG